MTPHERRVRSFVTLYLEVEAGRRPARHLAPLLAPGVRPARARAARPGPTPEIRSVHLQVRPGVCEAVVLLREAGRISALVIALRRRDLGWQVAEARRPGELGGPPPTAPDQPASQEEDPEDDGEPRAHEFARLAAAAIAGPVPIPAGWRRRGIAA